jgi:3-hydroxyacyl-CoA dehydrogenase
MAMARRMTRIQREGNGMAEVVGYERSGEIAILRLQNPPVNALSHAVRRGLLEGMDRAEADKTVRAVLIVGKGRAFIAGADIREFGQTPLEPHLPDLCNRIEASPLLVVASMHGVSLGGGLEVALSVHYRIAQPTARVGLPEVHLGLIPGAGGTQRLPRVTGVDTAIDVITTGRHIDAAEALEMGILDKVVEGDPETVGLDFTRDLLDQKVPRRAVSEMPAPPAIDWNAAYAKVLKRGRGQLSPAQAVRAIQASVDLPFAQGLKAERQMFWDLMKTDQRKGMIHAFFAERAVSQLPELEGISPRSVERIGVIGGGTMGAGIATSALLAGLKVTLLEMNESAAQAATDRVATNLAGALRRGKLSQSAHDEMLGDAFLSVTDYAALGSVDLVIEAAFEEMDIKKKIFARLDQVCRPGAILATNTSYLDVNDIAASTARRQDVIGLHFFSPAHVMKLLEVVVADHTAPDVVATGFALGKRMGKTAVRAGVCDGFIGNRILSAYRTAADHMILDGASPFQIDKVLTDFGFAMGPFAVADLAGLDIGWAMRKRLAPTRDPRERVGQYPDVLCEAGHFGQKTGKGFYTYESGQRAGTPNPDVLALIDAERERLGITPKDFGDAEILRRYMAAMVNEGARIVGEGIARRPLDVDIVLLLGYGFPRFWGGPMKWADITGIPEVLADIERFAQEDAFFWQPAPLLTELAAKGGSFDDLNKET